MNRRRILRSGPLPAVILALAAGSPTAAQAIEQEWDGLNSVANGQVNGGSGIWNLSRTNWTNATGSVNGIWNGGTAVFRNPGGSIDLQASQSFQGLRFLTDGYTLDGNGSLTPTGNATIEIVGNSTAAIGATLVGAGAITKTGAGTLRLDASNQFGGGLTVQSGTLIAGASAALGSGGTITTGVGTRLEIEDGTTLTNTITLGNGATLANQGNISRTGLGQIGVTSTSGEVTILNSNGGRIAGDLHGVSILAGTVVNDGAGSTILASTFDGRSLANAVNFTTGFGTVHNSNGANLYGAFGGYSVRFEAGGSVINDNARIVANNTAVSGRGSISVINRNGSTMTSSFRAVHLEDGGSVINENDSSLGANWAILADGIASIENRSGSSIFGGTRGIQLNAGGTILNEAGSTISVPGFAGPDSLAVDSTGGALELTNAGQITGGVRLGNAANTITLFVGSNLSGNLALGTNTATRLILDGDSGEAFLSDAVAGPITGNPRLVKEGTGKWTLDRELPSLTNLEVNGGVLTIARDLSVGPISASGSAVVLAVADSVFLDRDSTNAIDLRDGAILFNEGFILATDRSVVSSTGSAAVSNLGEIVATGINGQAIDLPQGGEIANEGLIQTSGNGGKPIFIGGAWGRLENSGTITALGSDSRAAEFSGNAAINNSGLISTLGDDSTTLVVGGEASIGNSGRIDARGARSTAIRTSGRGVIVNRAAGVIDAAEGTAIEATGGPTFFTNEGTIFGNVHLADDANIVGLASGGRILGDLDLGNGAGTELVLTGRGIDRLGEAVSGRISNPESLTKFEDGRWIIDRDQFTAPGGILITSGTLQFGDGGTTGWIKGNIENSGSLVVNRSDNVNLDSVVTGSGQLIKRGGGKLTLSGANLYTGPTIIQNGTLEVTTLTLPGASPVTDDALLAFDQNFDGTFAGSISGEGSVVKRGSGIIHFTGRNTYTGGTSIEQGELRGGTDSFPGDIVNHGTITFDEATGGEFDGQISGSGATTKTGRGSVIFTRDQLYTGGTEIRDGALVVNASLASASVTVGPGAALGGSGTLLGDVFNAGLISPGNSPGRLQINGDFTQGSRGTLMVEIASRQNYDRLAVSGRASLDGALRISVLNGFTPKPGDEFTILTARDGVRGRFARVIRPAAIRFNLIYDDESVALVLPGAVFPPPAGGEPIPADATVEDIFLPFTDFAETPNQLSVAEALDSARFTSTGDLGEVIGELNFLPADELRNALDQISPQLITSFSTVAFTLLNAQNAQIEQRLAALRTGRRGITVNGIEQNTPLTTDKSGKDLADGGDKDWLRPSPESKWSAFVSGSGTFAKVASVYQLPRYRFESGALLAGLDRRIGDGLSVGLYAGYTGSRAKYDNGSRLDINGTKFGIYGTYARDGYYVNAVAGGGYNSYRMTRSVDFGSVNRTARSRPDAGELSVMLGGGKDWQFGNLTLGITTSLQYGYLGIGAFEETGADSLNTRVDSQDAYSLRSSLGGRIAYTIHLTQNISFIPEVRMSWQHEFLDYGRQINAGFDGGSGPGFVITSDSAARNNAFAGAGASLKLGSHWNAYAFYNPEFGGGEIIAQTISAGLTWSF